MSLWKHAAERLYGRYEEPATPPDTNAELVRKLVALKRRALWRESIVGSRVHRLRCAVASALVRAGEYVGKGTS